MIQKACPPMAAAPLFDGCHDTIVWSCLDGTMGEIFVDTEASPDTYSGTFPVPEAHPVSAMAVLGDFVFLAGAPSLPLLEKIHGEKHPFQILIPQSDSWNLPIVRIFKESAKPITRYATKKDPKAFSTEKLLAIRESLPAGCTLHPIDENIYRQCQAEGWSRDLVSQFPDWDTYRRLGLGIVVLADGKPVSGASSYSRYKDGIEIEIDTKESFRRKGLASACGAALILECLNQGLYPSWDAHTLQSLSLAQKLGYQPAGPYPAYEIT